MAKNELYWSYNMPLQLWAKHEDPEDDNSKVVGADVVNYMPRKERCCRIDLDDARGEQTREEFLTSAAEHLDNLARMFREAINNPNANIYYHDVGMNKL